MYLCLMIKTNTKVVYENIRKGFNDIIGLKEKH